MSTIKTAPLCHLKETTHLLADSPNDLPEVEWPDLMEACNIPLPQGADWDLGLKDTPADNRPVGPASQDDHVDDTPGCDHFDKPASRDDSEITHYFRHSRACLIKKHIRNDKDERSAWKERKQHSAY